MKIIDEMERCDTRCAAMRWSNSDVKLGNEMNCN